MEFYAVNRVDVTCHFLSHTLTVHRHEDIGFGLIHQLGSRLRTPTNNIGTGLILQDGRPNRGHILYLSSYILMTKPVLNVNILVEGTIVGTLKTRLTCLVRI